MFAESGTTDNEEVGSLQHSQATLLLLLQWREGTPAPFYLFILFCFLNYRDLNQKIILNNKSKPHETTTTRRKYSKEETKLFSDHANICIATLVTTLHTRISEP